MNFELYDYSVAGTGSCDSSGTGSCDSSGTGSCDSLAASGKSKSFSFSPFPFLLFFPRQLKISDDYDITAIENDELLRICLQEIKIKEFDNTTLDVISWGILKATEDEQWLSEEIEAIAPDGTMLKGVLEKQNCSGTWMTMSVPYSDLSITKHELIRNPRELLMTGYSDYRRLREMESKVRELYPVYLERISKLEKDSAWARHCVYKEVYGKLFDGMVLNVESLIKEWWGLIIRE